MTKRAGRTHGQLFMDTFPHFCDLQGCVPNSAAKQRSSHYHSRYTVLVCHLLSPHADNAMQCSPTMLLWPFLLDNHARRNALLLKVGLDLSDLDLLAVEDAGGEGGLHVGCAEHLSRTNSGSGHIRGSCFAYRGDRGSEGYHCRTT